MSSECLIVLYKAKAKSLAHYNSIEPFFLDPKSFLEKCAAKTLQGMEIEAFRLEYTDSVLVQGDMSKLTEDALSLYFSNNKRSGGGEVKSLIWVNKQKSVVISFEECHGRFSRYLTIIKYF